MNSTAVYFNVGFINITYVSDSIKEGFVSKLQFALFIRMKNT